MMQIASVVATPPRVRGQSVRRRYAVILASGAEDGGKRATLALAAACTAQAMELDTIVFLVGDGAHWAYEGRAEGIHAPGFPPLAELLDAFLESGGQVLLCSACDAVCSLPADAAGTRLVRRDGVRPEGLAAVLAHSLEGNTVTF